MPVGGRTAIRTDVRIVAATNKSLDAQITQGQFREDLYYRLNVVPLRVPPLRERAGDVPDLVQHFLASGEKHGLPPKTIQPEAMALLKRYHWPGNVRELENLVNRLAALYAQDEITAEIVAQELPNSSGHGAAGETQDEASLAAFMDRYLTDYFAQFGEDLPPPGLYERIISEVEHPLISAALAATGGNQIRAAALLGLNRNTLRKKIREHDIRLVRSLA